MTIYLDDDFKCHLEAGDGLRAVNVDWFDGKDVSFIEGYRYVPAGETWTRSDGVVFAGEMIAPWTDYSKLEIAQAAYERGQAEADDTIAAMVEDIYNMDMEEIENV